MPVLKASIVLGSLVLLIAYMSTAVSANAQTPASAERPASDSPAVLLSDVVVSATRVEKSVKDIPAAVGVVGKDDVQLGRQQLNLDESLTKLPGLFLQSGYNFAQDLRVSIRGFGARANFGIRGITVIVDGIPQTLPDGQSQVDSIDLGSIEQITVIRGPSSSLYGNASGGVINIDSEDPPTKPFIEPRLSWGDFGFKKYQLKSGGEAGKLGYMVNISDMRLDGYRQHSETKQTLLNGKLNFRFGPESNLTIAFNGIDTPLANDPGGLTRAQADQDPTQARQANIDFDVGETVNEQRLGFVYDHSLAANHQVTARNYYVWREFENKLPFIDGGAVDLDRFIVGAGVAYTNTNQQSRRNRLIVGIDVDHQDDERRRFDNNMGTIGDLTFNQKEGVTSLGIFLQDELRLQDHVELTIGLRYDHFDFEVEDQFLMDGDDSGQRTLDETSPMIGLLYNAAPTTNLYANISTGFETPTTTEFARPDGSGGFNLDLQPQKATNYEIGVKGQFAENNHYELSLFRIDVDHELIPFEIPGSPGRDFFVNAGRSRRDGLEFAFMTAPLDGLNLSLAYTYSDFVFEDFVDNNGNDFSDNTLPGVPDHLISAEVGYVRPSGFYALLDALYVDEFFVDNANTAINDSYTLANVRLGYRGLVRRWEIEPFIGIRNLLNERYNANVRINAFGGRYFEPGPDRNVYGGIMFRFDFGS